MQIELNSQDTVLTDAPVQFAFVVDADLASVGGGTCVVDY